MKIYVYGDVTCRGDRKSIKGIIPDSTVLLLLTTAARRDKLSTKLKEEDGEWFTLLAELFPHPQPTYGASCWVEHLFVNFSPNLPDEQFEEVMKEIEDLVNNGKRMSVMDPDGELFLGYGTTKEEAMLAYAEGDPTDGIDGWGDEEEV